MTYARTYGRAVGGRCAGGALPLRRGPSLTLISTLSVRGASDKRGAETAQLCLVRGSLSGYCPRLGDMLVLDNLALYKLGVVFLPPYSPDFPPIKQA
jgi:transposase